MRANTRRPTVLSLALAALVAALLVVVVATTTTTATAAATLTAALPPATTLAPNNYIFVNVSKSSPVLLSITSPKSAGPLSLQISPRWGGAFVHFVVGTPASPPTVNGSLWNGPPFYSGEPVMIDVSDANWPANDTFLALAYVPDFVPSNDTLEMIAWARVSSAPLLMRMQESVQVRLHANEIAYFAQNTSYLAGQPCTRVFFHVTRISGNLSDTLTYWSPIEVKPTPGDTDVYGPFGVDSTGSYRVVVANAETTGFIYFAVKAQGNATITVMTSHGCRYVPDGETEPAHVFLRNGIPQYLEINAGADTLGVFHMMSFQPLFLNETIVLTANIYGAFGTFYVTTNSIGEPTPANAIWSSELVGANHALLIGPDDPDRCLNFSCWYYIVAVPASDSTSNTFPFAITVTQLTQFTKLQNGVATTGVLAPPYTQNSQNFEISIDRPNARFFVQLMTILGLDMANTNATLSLINPQWRPDGVSQPFLLSMPLTWDSDIFAVYVRPDNYSSLCTPANTLTCRFVLTVQSSNVFAYAAMYTDSPLTTLSIGEKVTHYAFNDPIYFRFPVTQGYGTASFQFETLTGYYDVYVSNKLALPVPGQDSTYQFNVSALESSDAVLTIAENDPNACTPSGASNSCAYTIAVVPRYSVYTSFTVRAFINNTTNSLTNGEVVYGLASPQSPDYYVLFVPSTLSPHHLRIALTGRNATVYVSLTDPRPTPANTPMNQTVLSWFNYFTLANQTTNMYYFAVYAYEYSLLVYTENATDASKPSALTQLTIGRPLRDSIVGNRLRYYVVDLSGEYSVASMIVQLNVFSGAAVWYASRFDNDSWPLPGPSNYQWIGDERWPERNISDSSYGRYCIAVQAANGTSPSFSIAVTMLDTLGYDSIYRLEDSRYTYSYIAPFQIRTYALDVPAPRDTDVVREVRIGLTSLLGDAEIFVSCGTLERNLTSYTWRGFDAGAASVIVHPHDPRACPPPTTYYVRVYSHEASAVYTIHATAFGNTTIIELPSRIAVNFATPRNNTAYFYYRPHVYEDGRGLTLTTSPSYGAAYMYVSVFNMSSSASFVPPSVASAQWSSLGDFSGSILDIPHDNPNLCHIPADFPFALAPGDLSPCVYVIAVSTNTNEYNFSLPTQYTLLAGAHVRDAANDTARPAYISGHVLTANHVPVYRYTPNDTVHYYTVLDLDPSSDFFVTLTPISGLVELIVGDTDYPNATTHFFSSLEDNTHTFQWRKNSSDIQPARVIAAVRAWSNATYTIVVGQVPIDRPGRFPTRLNDALPQYDSLSEFQMDTWRYYVYYLPVSNVTLSISIPRRMGDIEAYIAYEAFNTLGDLALANRLYPTADPSTYNGSMVHHSFNSHQVANAQAGRYVIGVHATTRTDYLIQVTASLTGTVLLFDSPMIDTIVPDPNMDPSIPLFGVRRYKLEIPDVFPSKYAGLDLVVNVAHLAGHTRLVLSNWTQPFPDPTNPSTYLNSSEEVRLNTITVPASQVQQGLYWLTVFGETPATYTISATFYMGQELLMGVPQNSYVPANSWQYYHLVVAGTPLTPDVLITSTQMHGQTSVYVVEVTKSWSLPNATNNIASASWSDSGVQAVRINNTCVYHRCTYLVGVQSWSTSPARYNLLAVPTAGVFANNASTLIQPTVPTIGRSPHIVSHVAHYAFRVMTPLAQVSLVLTDLGSAGLRMAVSSTDYPVFDASTYTLTGPDMISNYSFAAVFTVNNTAYNASRHTYFVTVATFNSSAIYSLSLFVNDLLLPPWSSSQNASAVYLIDGELQYGVLPAQFPTYTYWEFVSPAGAQPIKVALDSLSPLDLVLYARWDGKLPTPSFSQASSIATGMLTFDPTDATGSAGCPAPTSPTSAPCRYLIAAYRSDTAALDKDLIFGLTAYQLATPMLSVGLQTVGFVAANSTQAYGVLMSQSRYVGQQFSLVLTPSEHCFAWANVTRTVSGTVVLNQYTQDVLGVHGLSFPLPTAIDTSRTDFYYEISVTSFMDCSFTLLVATNESAVVLEDEVPVPFWLPVNSSQLFVTLEHSSRDNVSIVVLPTGEYDMYMMTVTNNLTLAIEAGRPGAGGRGRNHSDNNGGDDDGACVLRKFFSNIDQEPVYIPTTSCLAGSPYLFVNVAHRGEITSSFRVLVHVDDNLETIVDNKVLPGFVASGGVRAFRYTLDSIDLSRSLPVRIGVTTLSLLQNITVCASATDKLPSPGTSPCASSGIWSGAALWFTPDMDNRYVYIAVHNMDVDYIEFRLQASMGPVLLDRAYQYHDKFLNDSTCQTKNFYRVQVREAEQVLFHVISLGDASGNPMSYTLRVSTDPNVWVTPETSTMWSLSSFQFGNVLGIPANDPNVQTCLNMSFSDVGSAGVCELFLSLEGCPKEMSTLSLLVATNDFFVSPSSLFQSVVNVNEYKVVHTSLMSVSAGVSMVVEQCYGQTAAYLSYDYDRPDNTSSASSALTTQPNVFTLNATDRMYANIAVYGEPSVTSQRIANVSYRFFAYPTPFVAPKLPSKTPVVVQVGDSTALQFVPSNVDMTLTYTVVYLLTTDDHVVLFTACGVETSGASILGSYSASDLQTKYATSTGAAQIPLSALDGGDDKKYMIAIIVSYSDPTQVGYTAYQVLTDQVLPASNNGKASESSNHTTVIVMAVLVPLVVLLLGGFVYYYLRSRKLQQELNVELPEMDRSTAAYQSQRRSVRGPDAGGAASSGGSARSSRSGRSGGRGGNADRYSSLLDDHDDRTTIV